MHAAIYTFYKFQALQKLRSYLRGSLIHFIHNFIVDFPFLTGSVILLIFVIKCISKSFLLRILSSRFKNCSFRS